MDRKKMTEHLEQVQEWDIIIIGGGATGLGAAVDAASRGYKTLLVEQYDFAKGSSSRSTKLVHGGVRYLAQGNIKLVRESLRERGILLRNAPHVCHNIPFLLPFFSWWEKWYYSIGLKFYDLLSGKSSLGKTSVLSKKTTQKLLPSISSEKLTGAVLYHDGQFDDSRLAINIAQTAAEQGATIINYCKLVSITKTGSRISGVVVNDILSGKEFSLNCKVIINATGVFTDNVMQMDDPQHKPIITVSQGIHIVVDKKFFPGENAMIIPKTDDGRVLFAVPWHEKIVIGTTDTALDEILIEPKALKDEVDFVMRHVNRYLNTDIKHSDVRAVFAGLRPLIKMKGKKSTSFLPRDHTTIVSNSGMVTITGGKWTTYRTMGKSAVDNAIFTAKLPKKQCVTESLLLHGFTNVPVTDKDLSVYGSDATAIEQLMKDQPYLQEKIHPELPYTKATVIWAIRNEMAMTVEDILARRTRALILDARASIESAPQVAALMAKEMNKSTDWEAQQVKNFLHIAEEYLIN
jgi:glycerol-3-phosphate dehydrogenase